MWRASRLLTVEIALEVLAEGPVGDDLLGRDFEQVVHVADRTRSRVEGRIEAVVQVAVAVLVDVRTDASVGEQDVADGALAGAVHRAEVAIVLLGLLRPDRPPAGR